MDSTGVDRLVFVYNAKSGIGSALLGSAHKILSPGTYDCNLCAITFGVFSENKKWKEFRRKFDLEMEFLHLDEFMERYPNENYNNRDFPKVFVSKNGRLVGFFEKEEINAMKNQEDLISGVQEKYAQ
ncbi:GTPase [Arenibacter sp. BSSL-BM3]|uniref:GTPase n=1 Tax=Arenibacter arenosicollis TaxID=2762274 RepID=A0ABR7QIX9_9FLAO|nr:GTPase [Arenibacter arenosicollis]MBC8767109.1 GTPase [Arenibacter arenosicollis]